MELTAQYIASQVVTFFVYVFLSMTYFVKERKLLITLSFLSNFLNAVAFALLGAYTSSAMCCISIFRDLIFYIDEKKYGKSTTITKKDIGLITLIYSISITAIVLTFNGIGTLLYAAGSMLYTFSIWQKNTKVYKFFGIPVTLIVIADSIKIKSYVGVILQTVVLISSIYGYLKESKSIEKMKLIGEMKNEEIMGEYSI